MVYQMVQSVKGPLTNSDVDLFSLQELAQALSKWCFRLSGVLRVVSVDHHLASDPKGSPPAAYTIKVQ